MVVDRGIQREGTGFFDALEDSLLVEIISQLSLKDRLSAATVVCKSWRCAVRSACQACLLACPKK